ncbi:MAG: SDR family oxidoreductase [Acidimicrobiia bacterium]|nr:SDR family oxidoreductase [Acidimicrobiia bacterium]
MGALDGKVALITGAGSGIGRATAERFAQEGASVFCVDIDTVGGEETAATVSGIFSRADTGDSDEVDAVFAECESKLGGVDIAFLNAGIAIGVANMTELSNELYTKIMRVNVDGVFYGARAAIRAMQRRGGGAIVATSSLAGLIPFQLDPVYDLTKHAVVGFIRSIAPTLVPLGITANTVNPGMTDTKIMTDETKALFEKVAFPLMPASQIADAVLSIVTTGRTGECWVCQPGRDAEPYHFHEVPGPRIKGASGRRPPGQEIGEWAMGSDG